MKKFTKAFLVAICALTATFAFSACFNNDDTSSGDASVSETSVPASSSEIPEVSSDEESSREESVVSSEEQISSEEESVFSEEESISEELSSEEESISDESSSEEESISEESSPEEVSSEEESSSEESSSEGELPKNINVMKPTDAVGYTIEGADSLLEGETYAFSVNIFHGYKAGEEFSVTVNGREVEINEEGKYVVENVTSTIVILVSGVEEVRYTATFTCDYEDALKNTSEGFRCDAEYYTFTIELSNNYTNSAANIAVYYVVGEGEETLVEANEEGVYSIANPQSDITIVVKNVALNVYKITFKRNAEVKYTLDVNAGSVLTEEQLSAAAAAVLNEGEEFVAWREDVTMEIVDDTVISAVTKPVEAWGELVEGNPLTDGTEVELGEGEYSAAGYEKVYVKAAIAKGPFADIDVSGYSEIRFAFKHTDSWVLFDGWSYYIDHRNTWIDVSMTNSVSGDWTVTICAPVNHSFDGGSETLNPYVTTLSGATLNKIFADWENESTTLYLTEIRGEKIELFGETVVEQAVVGSVVATDVAAPAGYEKVYGYDSVPAGTSFADVDVSGYEELRFAVLLDNGYICIQGWGAYAENSQWGDNWVPVTLVNSNNTWTITIEARLSGANVTNTTAHTYSVTSKKLSEVLATWFDFAAGAEMYFTEIRGVAKAGVSTYGEEIVEVAIVGATVSTDKTAPDGFEKVYAYADIPANTAFADVSISGYSEVKFQMILDNGYICIQGWGAYAENARWGEGWILVTLTNNGSDWTVTIGAYVTGANVNPYTYTTSGSKLSEVLSTWFDFVGGAGVYVTEARGIAKEIAFVGEVIESGVLGADYLTEDATADIPEGFEKVYAVDGTFDNNKKSTEDLSAYSEVQFAIKSNKYFLMDGWSIYFQENFNDWAKVVMMNNGDGTWEVTVYGNVWDGSGAQNPFTITYEGNSISTILTKWYNGSNIYVTELRGVKA